jgi:hypothetical protein
MSEVGSTHHEVGTVDYEITLLSILIAKNTTVDTIPTECICDHHYNALGGASMLWLSYVCWYAVERCDGASWCLGVYMTCEAVWARHLCG